MNGLVTFFESSRQNVPALDPLKRAIDSFKEEKKDEAFLFSIAADCRTFSIDTRRDLIAYYRSLISLLFLRKFYRLQSAALDEHIQILIRKGVKRGVGKRYYLQRGYEVLATYLFEGRKEALGFSQLEKGAGLHKGFSHPIENGEMGLITLYLGLVWDDEDLLHIGLKSVEFALTLCDHHGNLFQGLWLKEAECGSGTLHKTFALLFNVVSQFVSCSKLAKITESFKGEDDLDPFIFLFSKAFKNVAVPKMNQKLTLHTIDRSLGFLHYHYGEISLVCSAAGMNTGLGCLHKKEVQIVSMGPHYAPLADSDYYGVVRFSNGLQEGFKDLQIESSDEKGKFRGWTRVISPDKKEEGQEWLFFNLEAEKENIDLTVRKSHADEQHPLFYAFFISADRAIIGKEVELFPGMLDRYEGNTSQILFEKGKEKLEITPCFNGEMKLIPLAGKKHFWSADFLLAFTLKKKLYPYRWTVN